MKSSRKRLAALLAALLFLLAALLHAELSPWVQHLAVETGLRSVFFRTVPLGAATVDARRAPRETIPELTSRIAQSPKEAALYRLRAGESELALNFTAAEADWKTYAQLTNDRMALADFYNRRLRPAEEIATLDTVATPAAFERAITLAEEQALPGETTTAQYRLWTARYPLDTELHKRFIRYLVDHAQYAAAEREIAGYRRTFPKDESIWVEEVGLTLRRGNVDQAIATFDKSFRPLMPANWLKGYFDLLAGQGRLRDFVAQARAAAQSRPEDLDPAARLFHYYLNQNNQGEARRVLIEYRARKTRWTAAELFDTARLFESVQEWDYAARQYYALYSLPNAGGSGREHGLAGLAHLLLTAPEQNIHFGSGDLSLYKDVATMDPHPGFLNGILSLVLNTAEPREQYDRENQLGTAYFHRARAAQLLALLDAQFPKAEDAPELHAALIEAYAAYSENYGVIQAGRKFLETYPHASQRTQVSLRIADAYARLKDTQHEFAIYDALLSELPARDAQYGQVLDRYIARLVAVRSIADALKLYRREIDRNANDPALYEKLAAFLEQNRLAAQVEQVYKQAIAQFPGASWQEKLARWYLRHRRTQDFAELTRQITRIFSGTDLETYFANAVATSELDPALYRQVNLYAHDRFPDDLVFVRNLLAAYTRRGTADRAAYTQLLRAYWYYDPQLRSWMFEALSRSGRLSQELAAAGRPDAAANPAAAQFYAEGEAWRGHFEAAAPAMAALANQFPGDGERVLRAATLERSLSRTTAAVQLARNLESQTPRDREALARIGDIYADRELYAQARPYWNRMAQIEPGKPEGYLEAATVFWDYFLYDDALRLLGEGRARLHSPALYAYEAGAIYEGKRDYPAAIREYIKAAAEESPARVRLLQLAHNPAHRAAVESATATAPLPLRAALLEAQDRTADLEALLRSRAASETSAEALTFIQQTASRLGFGAVERVALERQAAMTRDPVDRIRLRLDLARFDEGHSDLAAARRTVDDLLRENPAILGVVRAATDFYWRNKLPAEAIATLTQAAARANQEYRVQFTYEAARKATESRAFDQARGLLAPLLAADPYNAQYLAAQADTFAQAGDDRGLRDFYTAAIDALKKAPIPAAERATGIAGLRRGLIPALTRLHQPAGAIDQYIELINAYPEDQGLIREAALYATQNRLEPRLTAYYTKASADSSKDYRWPMVLARLDAHFENFDGAIAAYTRSIGVRPDRVDLYLARGTLEERLMRFSEAEQTYTKVWDLSYRNPQWLDKVAELQARQNKADAAIATLRKAYLEGHTESPNLLLAVAGKLEAWGLIEPAIEFARRAGAADLSQADTAVYARLMTRARQYGDVLTKLPEDRAALGALARAVNEYYTPEEKVAVAEELTRRIQPGTGSDWPRRAEQAGLYELAARWFAAGNSYLLIEVQTRRMRFEELAGQLQAMVAENRQNENRDYLLQQAAQQYAIAGDRDDLERVLRSLHNPGSLLPLVARDNPSRLLAWAGQNDEAVNLAIASGDAQLALESVALRARTERPVWGRAYTALTSLYYAGAAPDAAATFRQLLGTGTIGERLGKPVDRDRQLAGDIWFYYGARFGEYLSLENRAQAEDFLPSALEADPSNSEAYSALADWHAERHQPEPALTQYRNALELDPNRGEVYDRMAVLLWDQGHRDEAIADWQHALAAFDRQQSEPNLADSFWEFAPAAIDHIGSRNLMPQFAARLNALFEHYLDRHDVYRIGPLLEAALRYNAIDFASAPRRLLEELTGNAALKLDQRIAIERRIVELDRQAGTSPPPGPRLDLVNLLLDAGDIAAARAVFERIPAEARSASEAGVKTEIRLAAKTGTLDALLHRYAAKPESAPSAELLRAAATALRETSDRASANRILEFVYSRALDQGDFDTANFFGLAEVRLDSKDLPAALQLLRRAQLVAGDDFENLVPAAGLLERYGHKTEALEFLRARARSTPWDFETRVRLAENLDAIAANRDLPYRLRVSAARQGGKSGDGELALLARGHIAAAEAAHPFYYEARLAAAANISDPAARLQLLRDAIAIDPEDRASILPLFRAAFEAHRFGIAEQAAHRMERTADPALARQIAQVHERLGNNGAAEVALREAKLDREADEVKRREALRQQNQARRPQVARGLEQPRVVRPRLEAPGLEAH